MAGPEYEAKRGPNLGSRTIARHGVQAGTASVGLMGILQACIEQDWLTQSSAFLLLGVLPPLATSVWKAWDGLRMGARVNAALDKRLPPVSMLFIVLLFASGCAIQLGTAKPEKMVALDGTMLVACETKGILIAVGDADICSNSMRGGHVGRDFVDMTLGVVRAAGSIVAGFFSGLGGAGAGMQAAVAAPVAPAVVAPPAAPPFVPETDGSVEFRDVPAVLDRNPFTAPE